MGEDGCAALLLLPCVFLLFFGFLFFLNRGLWAGSVDKAQQVTVSHSVYRHGQRHKCKNHKDVIILTISQCTYTLIQTVRNCSPPLLPYTLPQNRRILHWCSAKTPKENKSSLAHHTDWVMTTSTHTHTTTHSHKIQVDKCWSPFTVSKVTPYTLNAFLCER